MGKVKRKNRFTGRGDADVSGRPAPLTGQILLDKLAKPMKRIKADGSDNFVPLPSTYLDQDLSAKILDQAQKQREELETEFGSASGTGLTQTQQLPALETGDFSSVRQAEDSDGSLSSDDGSSLVATGLDNEYNDCGISGENYAYEPIEISAEEQLAFSQFMPAEVPQRRAIADLIASKIGEKQSELSTILSDGGAPGVVLDPSIVEMYRGVGEVLSKYRSGRLPKAFKYVPKLRNWEQILYITEPDKWTAAAMYQATRIFCSNMGDRMCQRYYNIILLPRLRDDIAEYKKLNFHLYAALRKSLYKPAAFFKGILLPLCESGTCTLREATIIGSVLVTCSVPVLHAAAAMLKIAEMDYSGAASIFLRILMDKKYTLPYRVIDGLVNHFLRFATDKRELPVLWHQSLLVLVQRYKQDVSTEQKDALLELLRAHFHEKISPEIRQELNHAALRDVEMDIPSTDNPDAE